MPTLKASERRLLTLFGLVLIGLFTYFFVFEYLMRQYALVKADNVKLGRELTEKRSMMARAAETLPKRDWLAMSQPVAPDFILAAERLERFVLNSADREGLIMKDIGTVGEEIQPYYHSVLMEVEARGSIAAIVRWLAALQDQEGFRAVTRCEISPVQKKDPTELKCEARIEQWYAPAGSDLAMSSSRPERPVGVIGDSDDDLEVAEPGSGASEGSSPEEDGTGEPADGGQDGSGTAEETEGTGNPAASGEEAPAREPRKVLLPGSSRDGGRRSVALPSPATVQPGEAEVQVPEPGDPGEGVEPEPEASDPGGEEGAAPQEGEVEEVPAEEGAEPSGESGEEGGSAATGQPEASVSENRGNPRMAATGSGGAVFQTRNETLGRGAIPIPPAA